MNLKERLNYHGSKKEPFLFIISYDKRSYEVIPLKNLDDDIKYSFNENIKNKIKKVEIDKKPISFENYKQKFESIQKEIRSGNTYLINLTTQTKIKTNHTLQKIYENANGKFKLLYKDKFVSFSPERFIKIEQNKIYTYPMKGTIDASIEDAENKILNDPKELAEHTMVVDLLRNDLGIISSNINVEKFRYIDKIEAGKKKLLQVSSKISGKLKKNWQSEIGDIILSMLPAGSITGTPKKKTVEILKDIENYERGFFTGVFGVFDGETLDSAVMIRFIEKLNDGSLVYKSGGGITCDSDILSEYKEMIDKIYVP